MNPIIFYPYEHAHGLAYEVLSQEFPEVWIYKPDYLEKIEDLLWEHYVKQDVTFIMISDGSMMEEAAKYGMQHLMYIEDAAKLREQIRAIINAPI